MNGCSAGRRKVVDTVEREWNGSSRLANGRSSNVGQTVVHVLATAERSPKSMAATTTLCHKPQVSAVGWRILTA